MVGSLLGFASLGLVLLAIVVWFRWIYQVSLDGKRAYAFALLGLGAMAAVSSLTMEASGPASVAAGVALFLAIVWVGLRALSGQSVQPPLLALGEALPKFSAPDHNGEIFDSETLRGHPVLIKLFRGHW